MRVATYDDKKLVVDILFSAFVTIKEANSINFIAKQDHKREKRILFLMNYLFEVNIRSGKVFISNNETACLIVSFSDKERITLKTILLDLQLAFKTITLPRVYRILKRQQFAKKNYPKVPHIKPVILAVKNEEQNKGTGARLILETIKSHPENKLPIVIDTSTEENVKMYQKFGFKVFNKTIKLGFPFYFLILENQ